MQLAQFRITLHTHADKNRKVPCRASYVEAPVSNFASEHAHHNFASEHAHHNFASEHAHRIQSSAFDFALRICMVDMRTIGDIFAAKIRGFGHRHVDYHLK
jgi:hypothetical protein